MSVHNILKQFNRALKVRSKEATPDSVEFEGTDGSGEMIYSHDHAPGNAAGSIRVSINGVTKYIKFWAAE